jgi:hypothetical protein
MANSHCVVSFASGEFPCFGLDELNQGGPLVWGMVAFIVPLARATSPPRLPPGPSRD